MEFLHAYGERMLCSFIKSQPWFLRLTSSFQTKTSIAPAQSLASATAINNLLLMRNKCVSSPFFKFSVITSPTDLWAHGLRQPRCSYFPVKNSPTSPSPNAPQLLKVLVCTQSFADFIEA